MKISGHTTVFAVLGHPIGHTLSPVMHNAALQLLEMDGIYLAFDVHPDRLMGALAAMGDMGFGGVNLTVPLKEVARRGLDELDESARRLGAVNTVEFVREQRGAPARMRGHNTDGRGFLEAVREAFDGTVAGRSVFVLGCGGAGRAVAITCAAEGAARLVLADVDAERPSRVADEIRGFGDAVEVTVAGAAADWVGAAREADIVVQATPIGMKPDELSPLSAAAFRAGQWAFDLVYMYPETDFMKTARAAGARAANGLGMLLHQGARAFTIWTEREAPVQIMRTALEREVYGARG